MVEPFFLRNMQRKPDSPPPPAKFIPAGMAQLSIGPRIFQILKGAVNF